MPYIWFIWHAIDTLPAVCELAAMGKPSATTYNTLSFLTGILVWEFHSSNIEVGQYINEIITIWEMELYKWDLLRLNLFKSWKFT